MKKTLTSLAVATLLLSATGVVKAADNKEDWDEPIFIKGADLEGQDLQQTENNLGVDDNYETYNVNVNDVSNYIPNSSNLSYIYSSATIEHKKWGKGVDVKIDTPDNITKVTSEQYQNAAITAGIKNAEIHIASVDQVTGEGALAGIYKVYEEKGNNLNAEDIQNSNQEMNDLGRISEENKGKDGYSDEALNASIADIKEQLADIKQNQDKQITQQQVEETVNKVLDERGLSEILSENQIQMINNNMVNVANSNALTSDPKAFKQNAKDVLKNIEKNSDDLLNKVKDKAKDLNTEENRNLLQRIWDGIVEIIQSIIQFFSNLLNKL
ncbi:Predicted secreted protein [Mycobacteroides abscessus subsp. abscessus]|nr:Predicted secreted protein [Mycobacteroides abscessus subsp. abscessus]